MRESLDGGGIALLRNSRIAIEQVWQRLSAHSPSPEIAQSVGHLKSILGSEQFIEKLGEIGKLTSVVLDAYKKSYLDLFDKRRKNFESSIEAIKNRPEWEPLAASKPEAAISLLSQMTARLGTDEDRESVDKGSSLGKSSLTEMESDICAVDALKSTVLTRLQELSIRAEEKAPVRKVRVTDFFNKPIQTQTELDKAIELLKDSLQKYIDEGAVIIME